MHDPIRTTERYSRAEGELRADPHIVAHINQLVGDGESMIRIDTNLILRCLVLRTIDQGTGEFSEEAFRRACDGVNAFLSTDTLTHRYLGLLDGFSMAEDRLDLEGGCIITRLPKEEREHALSQNLLYGAIGGFSHSD